MLTAFESRLRAMRVTMSLVGVRRASSVQKSTEDISNMHTPGGCAVLSRLRRRRELICVYNGFASVRSWTCSFQICSYLTYSVPDLQSMIVSCGAICLACRFSINVPSSFLVQQYFRESNRCAPLPPPKPTTKHADLSAVRWEHRGVCQVLGEKHRMSLPRNGQNAVPSTVLSST